MFYGEYLQQASGFCRRRPINIMAKCLLYNDHLSFCLLLSYYFMQYTLVRELLAISNAVVVGVVCLVMELTWALRPSWLW